MRLMLSDLQDLYDQLNACLFDDALPTYAVTIGEVEAPHIAGWTQDNGNRPSIVLHGPYVERYGVVLPLIHEMMHLACDCADPANLTASRLPLSVAAWRSSSD